MLIFFQKHMKFTTNDFFQEKMRIRKFYDDAMENKGTSHTNLRFAQIVLKCTVHIFHNYSKTINSFHLLFFLLENIIECLSRKGFMDQIGSLKKKLS